MSNVGVITEQGYPFGEGCNLGYSPIKEEDMPKRPEDRDRSNKDSDKSGF